jgi:phage tail sheath protein FI
VVRNFLEVQWRRGQLDGATPEEAFYVICDETTNPTSETEAGRLTCEIGLRPPWPAEFVVVRIRKRDGVTETVEMTGGGRDA